MARRATVEDVHRIAAGTPHVRRWPGTENAVYQVGGKSFVFFRESARPDAVDPVTRERYDDVIVFWVASEDDKQAMVLDPDSPYFTTAHFDGHPGLVGGNWPGPGEGRPQRALLFRAARRGALPVINGCDGSLLCNR